MKTYGVLLIGCGRIGMEHLQGLYYQDNVNIVAVVDADDARAQHAAKISGAKHFGTNYKPYLEMEEIDIVIIATYVDSHLSILEDCLKHGKHVLCEKPMTANYEDGKRFVEAAKSSNSQVLIAHILRYNKSYKLIKDIIASGAIGEVRMIRMTQNHHTLDWPRYKRLMQDCSPTLDCGIHYYDIAEWLTGGKITEVNGFGATTQDDAPCPNYTLVTYVMDNGCKGYYEAGWGQTVRSGNLKEFIGTEGRITLEMRDKRAADNEEGDLITVYDRKKGKYETYNVPALYKDIYAQLSTLINLIEGRADGVQTIDEAWRAFNIALAADRSIKSGKPEHVLN